MIDAQQYRIGLTVAGLIIPAWTALTNNHRLRVELFRDLTRKSPLVPAGRADSIAQALYYGYCGDFFTAAQLLAPQVENIVRVQLVNSGVHTRQFDDGVQTEVGLSSLMERKAIDEILGEDIAFEIRALFCTSLGPNLRNEYAHGLVGDEGRSSSAAIYCWWLTWKILDWDFSNHLHDVDAVDALETALPAELAS